MAYTFTEKERNNIASNVSKVQFQFCEIIIPIRADLMHQSLHKYLVNIHYIFYMLAHMYVRMRVCMHACLYAAYMLVIYMPHAEKVFFGKCCVYDVAAGW